MNNSLRCSENLMDVKEEYSTGCLFSFHSNKRPCSPVSVNESYGFESSYLPMSTYAMSIQNCETLCKYREHTYLWMLGICRDKGSHPSVAYCGMNYFDRFLSVKVVSKENLELLSWLCLHLSSSLSDNRTKHLTFKEICCVINDTYSLDKIKSYLYDLLTQLDFILHPYSPYLDGGAILERTHYSSLYPSLLSLLNGVCMKYDSLMIPPQSITYVCIALVWSFSYPAKDIPRELCMSDKVLLKDVDSIIRIVKELFPMMRDVCINVIQHYSKKVQQSVISPTSAVSNN